MNTTLDPSAPSAPESASPSAASHLFQIFLEPRAVFEALRTKPVWILPLMAIIVLGLFANFFIIDTIGYENIVRQQMMQNAGIRDMPRQQREDLIEQQASSEFFEYFSYVGSVLAPIMIAIVAGLLFLAVMAMGGEIGFKHSWSLVCHTFFAYSVVYSVLAVLVVSLSATPEELNVQNIVQANAGVLVDQSSSPVLHSVASSLDLLTFYHVFLVALGVSVIAGGMAFPIAFGAIGGLWVIWIGLKAGFAMLLG